MKRLIPLIAGLLFGIGLIISGMTNPAKVLGFLDLAGLWNPSLAFVMIGAIAIASIAFAIAKRRSITFFGDIIQIPTARHIDRRLLGGSLLFGIGWGIAGICPGPALVLVGSGISKGIIFTIAMLVGMLIFEVLERSKAKQIAQ